MKTRVFFRNPEVPGRCYENGVVAIVFIGPPFRRTLLIETTAASPPFRESESCMSIIFESRPQSLDISRSRVSGLLSLAQPFQGRVWSLDICPEGHRA